MKRKYKQWFASLGCLTIIGLSACADLPSIDEFEEALNGASPSESIQDEEATSAESWRECQSMADCPFDSLCISGTCINTSAGGGNECESNLDCPDIDNVCSSGVCI